MINSGKNSSSFEHTVKFPTNSKDLSFVAFHDILKIKICLVIYSNFNSMENMELLNFKFCKFYRILRLT